MNFQRDMDRAKSQRRKVRPKPAVLCALASLREKRISLAVKDFD
jgi:hypothetical protein